MHSWAYTHPTSGKITQNVCPTDHDWVAFFFFLYTKNRPLTFRRDSARQAENEEVGHGQGCIIPFPRKIVLTVFTEQNILLHMWVILVLIPYWFRMSSEI